MTPGSFIVDHSTLLARSHRDYMRSRCDSSSLSTRSYWAFLRSQCAQVVLAALSLRFQCVCNTLTMLTLRVFCDLISIFLNFGRCLYTIKNKWQSHLPTIMMALSLRVRKYKSPRQSETRSLRAIWWRVKGAIGSPWATLSAKPWRLFWACSKQAQRVGALARATLTQCSRHGSANGAWWAYWGPSKSKKKASWGPRIFPCGQWRI